jgi:hypothetical protein
MKRALVSEYRRYAIDARDGCAVLSVLSLGVELVCLVDRAIFVQVLMIVIVSLKSTKVNRKSDKFS